MGRSRSRAWVAVVLAAAWLALSVIPARAAEYDPEQAGHPLRVIAYVLHPVGVALDYLIFRPAYWLGSKEPLRTIFGVDQGLGYDDGGTAAVTATGSMAPEAKSPEPKAPEHSPPPPPQGPKN